ncbi:PREDICTED: kappa-casein [Hipposideros armiger]|uniref:Kappa-casein n=1 Tax=Hipposideros armiger TaxID=186990 RepID=A0A8B7T2I9_HIPAR|nr:PREDICTED: kappa-casein [Hipposideros armiger]
MSVDGTDKCNKVEGQLNLLASKRQQAQGKGAEEQNQEQQTCRENNERLFNQNTVKYIPIQYVLNSYSHFEPHSYQYRPAIPIKNQYMPYPYYAKPVAARPHVQIPQWQIMPNIYPHTVVRHAYQHPSFIAVPPKKVQDKTVIPNIKTIATVNPTFIPNTEPMVNSVVTPEASSEFITSLPETTTVTSTMV